jgi:hypothetical protein
MYGKYSTLKQMVLWHAGLLRMRGSGQDFVLSIWIPLKTQRNYVSVTSATSFAAPFTAYNLSLYKCSARSPFFVDTAPTQRYIA